MDVERRQRRILRKQEVDSRHAGQQFQERGLTLQDNAAAPCLYQRDKANKLNGIAQALLGVKQYRAAI